MAATLACDSESPWPNGERVDDGRVFYYWDRRRLRDWTFPMFTFALRVVINAAALWVAAYLLDGIVLSDNIATILLVALVFGLINALVRPVALLLSLPVLLLSLGLFTLVVNAGMLALTAWLTDGLSIDGFWPAFLGAIIISLTSWGLSSIIIDDD